MAKFASCIRNKRSDGLYPVYIRVFHNGSLQYINTGLLVNDRGLKISYTKSGKKQTEISDHVVQKECLRLITTYAEKINKINARDIDCKKLIDILTNKDVELSFSEYAEIYIKNMYSNNRKNPAKNYILAVRRLHEFMNSESILFKDLTSNVISNWIDSMNDSIRKKSLYPTCLKAIFNSAIRKYNDYDLDIIRIRTNPFVRVKIPKEKKYPHRSVSAKVLNKLFSSEIKFPEEKLTSRMEMSFDVAHLIFFLAGINVADLYDLKQKNLDKNWLLCYNRKKTRDKSDSGAYIEITVPENIRPLFSKYKGQKGHLFSFQKRFSEENNFLKTVNKGLKSLCVEIGIKEKITTYTFRHSWATIAQNECDASTEQVAFALNHSSAHKVTEGYIKKDYTQIDRLNQAVIKFALDYKEQQE